MGDVLCIIGIAASGILLFFVFAVIVCALACGKRDRKLYEEEWESYYGKLGDENRV